MEGSLVLGVGNETLILGAGDAGRGSIAGSTYTGRVLTRLDNRVGTVDISETSATETTSSSNSRVRKLDTEETVEGVRDNVGEITVLGIGVGSLSASITGGGGGIRAGGSGCGVGRGKDGVDVEIVSDISSEISVSLSTLVKGEALGRMTDASKDSSRPSRRLMD